jgi:hypothetical protein
VRRAARSVRVTHGYTAAIPPHAKVEWMPYAVVQDFPASWERYAAIAAAIEGEPPAGLILHVAGPTDEGFRTIEIWETRDAWARWHDRSRTAGLSPWALPTLRELAALNAVCGLATATPTSSDLQPTTAHTRHDPT